MTDPQAMAASPEQRMAQWSQDRATDPAELAAVGDAESGFTDPLLPPDDLGIDPGELAEEDLLRELRSLHRTRLDTLRHAADSALANHLRRTAELETEYLTRHPGREIDPARLREGQ